MPAEPITIAMQIACVKREIAMRKNVYRKKVLDGRMTQADAAHEIRTMEEVLRTLQQVEQPDLVP